MTVTISKLNYMLTVDASGLDKGLQLSRKEVSQMKRDMRELQTPMEKYETQLAKAAPLLKLGAEGQELYNRKMAKAAENLKREQRAAWEASKAYKALQFAKKAVAGIAVGLVGATAASVRRDLAEIDKLAKASDRLNVETEQLTALQFTVAKTSGLTAEQTTKGLEKMVRRTAEAAVGLGEAQASLKELGLDAKELAQLQPDEMFRKIAGRMSMVNSEAAKLRLATKIFDDEQAGIFTTLDKGVDYIDAMNQRAKELGMTFNRIEASQIEAANDAMLEMETAMSAFSRAFTISIAPQLLSIINELTRLMEQMGGTTTGGLPETRSSFTAAGAIGDYTAAGIANVGNAINDYYAGDFEMLLERFNPNGPKGGFFFELNRIEEERAKKRSEAEFERRTAEFAAEQDKARRDNLLLAQQGLRPVFDDFLGGLAKQYTDELQRNQIRDAVGAGVVSLFEALPRVNQQRGVADWLLGSSQRRDQSSSVDVMESITSGSSEAFKLEFRRVAKQDAQLKETKRVGDNTSETNSLLNELLSRFQFEESNLS